MERAVLDTWYCEPGWEMKRKSKIDSNKLREGAKWYGGRVLRNASLNEKGKLNICYDSDVEDWREQARTEYKQISEVVCPAFPNERIVFNAKGFSHLLYQGSNKEKARPEEESQTRFETRNARGSLRKI